MCSILSKPKILASLLRIRNSKNRENIPVENVKMFAIQLFEPRILSNIYLLFSMNNLFVLTTRRKVAASYILNTFDSRSDSRRRVCRNLTFSVLRMINYKSWKLNGFQTVFQVFHYSGVSYRNELVSMCKLKVA